MTTTDFSYWLNSLAEQDAGCMANLYQSVTKVTQMGEFKTTKKGARLFVKADGGEDTLMISTGLAEKTFLDRLNREFGGEFGWVHGAAGFERAMEKND